MTSEQVRTEALVAANNECARCGKVAWSRQLEALMELRPRRGKPDENELVCGACCAEHDAKKSKRGRAA